MTIRTRQTDVYKLITLFINAHMYTCYDIGLIFSETMENTGEDIDTQLRVLTTISYDTADVVDFDSLEVSSVRAYFELKSVT